MRKKVTCHCEGAQSATAAIQKKRLDCFALWARNDVGGFTLAEVLITLGIIGVVAALTMPSLIQKQNDRATVAKVKKMYSVISNAVRLWQAEEGCDTDVADCIGQYAAYDCQNAFSGIEKKLNIVDRVYQNQSKNVAWLPAVSYGLDGSAAAQGWEGVSQLGGSGTCEYLLNDGVTMTVHMPDEGGRVSGFIFFDVNGPKAPNRVGKDIFPIGIGSYRSPAKGVNPYYTEDNSGNNWGLCRYRNGEECSPDDGKSPTAYVIAHDKLPDLVKMGYPK
ncbi:MAG: type II secretion system GspH family protein [Heliobacteriaceae bacterium]|jgi:prepilin-type N-terminal cleavage/methylation domain-containing protein|nr:type II secretion system GspH family protein [Heliobacteriaceae bacterium]